MPGIKIARVQAERRRVVNARFARDGMRPSVGMRLGPINRAFASMKTDSRYNYAVLSKATLTVSRLLSPRQGLLSITRNEQHRVTVETRVRDARRTRGSRRRRCSWCCWLVVRDAGCLSLFEACDCQQEALAHARPHARTSSPGTAVCAACITLSIPTMHGPWTMNCTTFQFPSEIHAGVGNAMGQTSCLTSTAAQWLYRPCPSHWDD